MSWWRRGDGDDRVVSVPPRGAPGGRDDATAGARRGDVFRIGVGVVAVLALVALAAVGAVVASRDQDQKASATGRPDHVKPTDLPGTSFVNDEFRFAIDAPGRAYLMGRDADGEWEYRVRFQEKSGDAVLTFYVYVGRDPSYRNDVRTLDWWAESLPTKYERSDTTLEVTKRGKVDGLGCVIVRSRQPAGTGEPLVILDYWIPAGGSSYVVRGCAPARKWTRVRKHVVEVMDTFQCW